MKSERFYYCHIGPRITTSVNFYENIFYFAVSIMSVEFYLETASVCRTANVFGQSSYRLKPFKCQSKGFYEGWNFNSGNYLFTIDTK